MKGLHNIGNTCFLNSCLQIFFEIPELKAAYEKHIQHAKSTTIFHELFHRWVALATDQSQVANPITFVRGVHQAAKIKGMDVFTGWAQNDVGEFIRFLLDCFHTCLQREVNINIKGTAVSEKDMLATQCYKMLEKMYHKEYSEIIDIFYAISISEIRQVASSNVLSHGGQSILSHGGQSILSHGGQSILSQTPEMYFILDLPIPLTQNPLSIYDCFDHYIKEETLSGENAWYNDKTGHKEEVKKQLKFWNFPKILIIALKRFQVSNNHISKIDRYIQYPERGLNLSQYVEDYFPENYVYDLFGVCNHMGSVVGGHCTSIVRPYNTNTWFLCDDAQVHPIETAQTQYAYVLFYRRR